MLNTLLPQERIIICHIQGSKNQSDQFGFVKPVAELIEGKLHQITEDNFCATQKVFITNHYGELEEAYPDKKLFQLRIRLSERNSENVVPEQACKYVATSLDATPIKPKDYFEVILSKLPHANSRVIVLDEYPGTNYIFIEDSEIVYGPFKWSKLLNKEELLCTIEIDFIDSPLPNVSLAPYQTYKFDNEKSGKFLVRFFNGTKALIQGLDLLMGAGYYDYSSDDEVLRYCSKLAGDQGQRILEKSRVDSLITQIKKYPKLDNELNKARLARLQTLTEHLFESRNDVLKSMSMFLNGDLGKPLVTEFIEKHENVFIEKLRKERAEDINEELKELNSEIIKAQNRVSELNSKKNDLNNDIQRLAEEREKDSDLSQVYAQSDEEIRKKRAEIEELGSKIQQLLVTHKMVEKLDTLTNEIEFLEKTRDKEKEKLIRAEQETKEINDELRLKESELQKKLSQLKPYVDAINGSYHPHEQNLEKISLNSRLVNTGSTTSRQKEIVDLLKASLSSKGRYYADFQIANFLVTIQQSFMTIFAGLPGTGKTSLARLLAECQNVKPRLREVAVARGWTSQKDLIGYFNPLTSRFQPANTGLYNFIKSLSDERNSEQPMAFVLLDEANLSPIEHYWSAFMGLSDSEQERNIILGNDTLNIPDYLRFIATINYDGTTEPLSPRLINRCPIIILDNPSDTTEHDLITQSIIESQPIAAVSMKELFGTSQKVPELEAVELAIYSQIKKVLVDVDANYGRPISISPRKENAIYQYCGKARMLMNVDNDLMALDFAIQQNVLPLIQGHGSKFAKRLELLKTILVDNDLKESARTLQRIISFGESDLQSFDFFCW